MVVKENIWPEIWNVEDYVKKQELCGFYKIVRKIIIQQ